MVAVAGLLQQWKRDAAELRVYRDGARFRLGAGPATERARCPLRPRSYLTVNRARCGVARERFVGNNSYQDCLCEEDFVSRLDTKLVCNWNFLLENNITETAFFFSFDYKKKEAGTTNTTHVILVVAIAKKNDIIIICHGKKTTQLHNKEISPK